MAGYYNNNVLADKPPAFRIQNAAGRLVSRHVSHNNNPQNQIQSKIIQTNSRTQRPTFMMRHTKSGPRQLPSQPYALSASSRPMRMSWSPLTEAMLKDEEPEPLWPCRVFMKRLLECVILRPSPRTLCWPEMVCAYR